MEPRDEVTGGWRKLHSEKLHNLYSSEDVIRVPKSRRMRWAEHVACTEEMGNAYIFVAGKLEGKDDLGDMAVDGRIILKLI
jgi:hypothetical protein